MKQKKNWQLNDRGFPRDHPVSQPKNVFKVLQPILVGAHSESSQVNNGKNSNLIREKEILATTTTLTYINNNSNISNNINI